MYTEIIIMVICGIASMIIFTIIFSTFQLLGLRLMKMPIKKFSLFRGGDDFSIIRWVPGVYCKLFVTAKKAKSLPIIQDKTEYVIGWFPMINLPEYYKDDFELAHDYPILAKVVSSFIFGGLGVIIISLGLYTIAMRNYSKLYPFDNYNACCQQLDFIKYNQIGKSLGFEDNDWILQINGEDISDPYKSEPFWINVADSTKIHFKVLKANNQISNFTVQVPDSLRNILYKGHLVIGYPVMPLIVKKVGHNSYADSLGIKQDDIICNSFLADDSIIRRHDVKNWIVSEQILKRTNDSASLSKNIPVCVLRNYGTSSEDTIYISRFPLDYQSAGIELYTTPEDISRYIINTHTIPYSPIWESYFSDIFTVVKFCLKDLFFNKDSHTKEGKTPRSYLDLF